ncbi:tryptophan--tRNA ligase, mitochondrial [Microplitis demolitor]|uniref:tryptophan--tRNA ligase, mitochondrial n=1 Tax=Microplitis demolitor TaxID=69319 RepID=UPI0004CD3767|nr:tryptophan--tRNA ligase, mitochondrial [Microplitis demolitor]XP_008558362.1 tryptophan--tRNA ligase, mitochondrial [Microplitis demolitor]
MLCTDHFIYLHELKNNMSIVMKRNIELFMKTFNSKILFSKSMSTETKPVYVKRIFSGIQPTGSIHLGNYLGAVKEWVKLQDETECLWSIVDLHAITMPQDAETLRGNIYKMAATLLACGIDPQKSIIFQQSTVSRHTELAWVLGCSLTMKKLALLPQFKEKSEKLKNIPVGLYTYPILQSADILLYKATDVPIGEDQLQHLHLAQHLVNYFNGRFGDTFPMPNPLINESSGRIKSLTDPTKKMSKSSDKKKSFIKLIDEPETIRKYIKKAVTDFTSEITYEPIERPGVSNLVMIHSQMLDKSTELICKEAQGLDTVQYKSLVADVIIEKLTPMREEYMRLMNEPDYVNSVLKNGSLKALPLADQCWHEVRKKVGFSDGILS